MDRQEAIAVLIFHCCPFFKVERFGILRVSGLTILSLFFGILTRFPRGAALGERGKERKRAKERKAGKGGRGERGKGGKFRCCIGMN